MDSIVPQGRISATGKPKGNPMSSPNIEQSIAAHEQELARLEQDVAVKRAVIAALRQVLGTNQQVQSKGAAAAVRELLAQHPNGMPTNELTDILEPVIETKSPNRRRIIQNTVNQLKEAGAVKLFKRGKTTYVRLS